MWALGKPQRTSRNSCRAVRRDAAVHGVQGESHVSDPGGPTQWLLEVAVPTILRQETDQQVPATVQHYFAQAVAPVARAGSSIYRRRTGWWSIGAVSGTSSTRQASAALPDADAKCLLPRAMRRRWCQLSAIGSRLCKTSRPSPLGILPPCPQE